MLGRALSTLAVGVFVAAAMGAACSDEAPAVASSSGSPPNDRPDAADGGTDTTSDAGRRSPERLCDPLPHVGSDIEELEVFGDAPSANGGTITPGTYVLIALEYYTSPPAGDGGAEPIPQPTGVSGHATVYVLSNAMRFNVSRGQPSVLPPDTTRGISYAVSGTNLDTFEECPKPGVKTAVPYTALAGAFALYPDSKHRELYQRVMH